MQSNFMHETWIWELEKGEEGREQQGGAEGGGGVKRSDQGYGDGEVGVCRGVIGL